MTTQTEFLEIDGRRFCRWKGEPPAPPRSGLTWHGALFGSFMIAAFFGLAIACLRVSSSSPDLGARLFASGSLVLFLVPYVGGVVVAVRRRKKAFNELPP